MRLFSCKANLENAVYMYHYLIYILHCGFLFWIFQFLWFSLRSTAVKSKPDSPIKHITVKTASALVTYVKIVLRTDGLPVFNLVWFRVFFVTSSCTPNHMENNQSGPILKVCSCKIILQKK